VKIVKQVCSIPSSFLNAYIRKNILLYSIHSFFIVIVDFLDYI
jgi:hypothetical protein